MPIIKRITPIYVALFVCVCAFDPLMAANAPAWAARSIALIHANLIPMTSEIVLADHTIVVENDRITAVGPSSQIKAPPRARVIDCRNGFVMPGLADMHMHLRYHWISDAWPVSPLKLYLCNGVTTIRCFGPGGKTGRYALKWRDEINAGRLVGPYILTCGLQLRGHFKEDPQNIVIRQKYQHFDFIKIYSYVTRNQFHSILSEAQNLNMYTAGHIPFQVGLDGVLHAGMDEIAHIEELLWEFSELDRRRYFETEDDWMNHAIQSAFNQLSPMLDLSLAEQKDMINSMIAKVVDKLKARPVPICTTLVIDDLIVRKLSDPQGFLQRPENYYLPPTYLDRFRRGREKHQIQFKGGEAFAPLKYLIDKNLLMALKAANIPLLLSTDAGTGSMGAVPGFSLHDELQILVDNGFTPYEALAAGTVVASKVVKQMNGHDDFGTIVCGKRADLLLLAQNPLDDVAHARRIRGVMAAGRWYDKKTLSKMLRIDNAF